MNPTHEPAADPGDLILSLLEEHEEAVREAGCTGDPATGLLLLTRWRVDPEVLEALVGNTRLSAGCRDRAAELLHNMTSRDAS